MGLLYSVTVCVTTLPSPPVVSPALAFPSPPAVSPPHALFSPPLPLSPPPLPSPPLVSPLIFSPSRPALQQSELVLQHHAVVLDQLLPALAGVITTPAESGDTRFFCLRMVSEVRGGRAGMPLGGEGTACRPGQGAGLPSGGLPDTVFF